MELRINWLWLIYWLISTTSYGTETFLCTIVTDQMHFLIFGKFGSGFLLGLALMLAYKKPFRLKNNKGGFISIVIVSILVALMLGFTLNGLVSAVKSGTNPGLMISLQLISTFVAFLLGKIVFGEKSSPLQIIGSMILIGSVAWLLISRSYHTKMVFHTEAEDYYFWVAAASMILGGIFYGMVTWVMKYALVHYSIHEYEFSMFQMIGSGILGMIFSILIKPSGPFLNFHNVWYNMGMIVIIGILAAFGSLFMYLAAARGTIQITQVIASSYPFVQILLEAIFMKKFLNLFEISWAILVLLGSALIVIFDTEENPVGGERITLNRDTERSEVAGKF